MVRMLKGLILSILTLAMVNVAWADVFITEIADPNNAYKGRFVELFNNGTEDVDLSEGWSLGRYTNANDYITTRLALEGVIPAGGFYIAARDGAEFLSLYGFAADLDGMANGPVDSNGDDNIGLFNPAMELVDFYGRPGEDGTGTDHEFEDGRAQRVSTVTTGNTTFDPAEWEIDHDSGGGDGPQDAPGGFDPRVWFTHSDITFRLMSVKTDGANTVELMYSHVLDSVIAATAANYSIDGGIGSPSAVTVNGNTAILELAGAMVHETDYVLTVNNVQNHDKTLTITAGSTIGFEYTDYSGQVVISEFVYNSEYSDNEWFEIYNASAVDIDITGWRFRDAPASHSPVIIKDTSDNVLSPGEYFTIYTLGDGEVNGWPLHFTPNVNAAIRKSDTSSFSMFGLNNSDDIIYMWDAMGNLVDSLSYDHVIAGTVPDQHRWGVGLSVEVVDLMLSNDDPTNWQASYAYGGTPGNAAITTAPDKPAVVISEVMYNSTDANDSLEVEWIEILNTEADSVDIGGWYMMDDNPTHGRVGFPAGTKIGPGDYMTILNFTATDTTTLAFTPGLDATASDIDLSDSYENVLLFDDDDMLMAYMHYDDGGAGEEFEHAATADGDGYSLELVDPTMDNWDPLNWKASGGLGGTPGTEPLDEFPPTLLALEAPNDTTLILTYSESVDSAMAVTLANYAVDGGIGVPTAAVAADFKVTLTVAAMTHNTVYTLTVSNVEDLSGNVIVAASTISATFQAFQSKIVINEFTYNSEFYDNEWIELYNASDAPIDIEGWALRDEPESHANLVIPDSIDTVIPAGGYFTIYLYGEGEEKGWPIKFTPNLQAALDYTDTTRNHIWNLNNSGDMIYLWDDLGNLVDFVDFTDIFAYPALARRGTGCTVELIAPTMDRNDPASWQSSYFYGGTPGAANVTVAPDYPKVVINEIMYNAPGDVEYEWVELMNAEETEAVDISGWYLMDDNPTHGHAGFPAGTTLGPGEVYTVLIYMEVDSLELLEFTPDFDGRSAAIGYSDSRDNCLLFNAADVMMTLMYYDDGTESSTTDEFKHAPEADGDGPSLVLLDASGTNWDVTNWAASNEIGGTPGVENFDTTPPVALSAVTTTDTSVVITFSEKLHPALAANPAAYVIDNGIGNPSAVIPDSNLVTLIVSPMTYNVVYTITMNNLMDMIGNRMAANTTITISNTIVRVDGNMLPDEFALDQNYPNPFNPTTTISYALPEVADVTLKVYDITGREMLTLVDESQEAGWYDLSWSGMDARGHQVATGIYFARIHAGDFNKVIKMMFIK